MKLAAVIATETSWPEAAIAIAGVALVGSVAVVVVWQALATWGARIAVTREEQYRALAERTARERAEIRPTSVSRGSGLGRSRGVRGGS